MISQLMQQRLRYARRSRTDDDRVIGGGLEPALGSISDMDENIRDSQIGKRVGGAVSQSRDQLDRVHFRREMGENRRLIARSRSNLEHAFPAGQFEQPDHIRDDERLRDRLTVTDSMRTILVRPRPRFLRNEKMARNRFKRIQNPPVADSPCPELALHHAFAFFEEVLQNNAFLESAGRRNHGNFLARPYINRETPLRKEGRRFANISLTSMAATDKNMAHKMSRRTSVELYD